jgi:hypothetical protein
MEEEGIWSSGFVFSVLADWRERKKKRCWPAASFVSSVRPGCRLLRIFFLLIFFVLIGCSCSHFNFLYFS